MEVKKLSGFRKNHHYVSQSYLKAWGDEYRNLSIYRILVSNDSVSLWQKLSIKSVAYHQHLYTRITAGSDSDELEKWMDQEIEAPAQKVLNRIRSYNTLTHDEWGHLVRFMALQDVRTPVRLMEHLNFMEEEIPEVIEKVLNNFIHVLENSRNTGEYPKSKTYPDANMIPLRLTKKIEPGAEQGLLKAEIIAGRSTWLFSIRHFLTKTYQVLKKHRWSVIKAPKGIEWFTSDNPVVKLNYNSQDSYDFKGGWGNEGTEILFPLSPDLLLYTQVGNDKQYSNISMTFAKTLQHLIAENAHRFIFSTHPIKEIERLRPRTVNRDIFLHERELWERWHHEQKRAELDLMMRDKRG